MRKPLENVKVFAERRARLAERMPGHALLLASPEETVRNGTVHFPFRQDSNLYYLTGFEEPETVLLFRPGLKPETILFVRTKNPERETWDGFRYGPEATQSEFKIDQAYPIEKLESLLPELLAQVDGLYYRMYRNPDMDRKVEAALKLTKAMKGRSGLGLLPVKDSDELLGELRVIKSDQDLANHRQACEISAQAHLEVMKKLRPNMNEREVHGLFIYESMKRGAAREGYNGIVAGGASATTLHYVFNDQQLKAGQLLLIDCGAEYNYFTGDITRTYPVAGKFTDAQREVYQGVLDVQKSLIEMVQPGISMHELNNKAVEMLTQLMLDLGLLTGRLNDVIETHEYRRYYPHRVGHFLGMDVHDLGLYYDKAGEPRKLEPGAVFTIEPGLYIPADDSKAPEEYRGIGVRIEDNILITHKGYENMTSSAPKEIADLEKIIGSAV